MKNVQTVIQGKDTQIEASCLSEQGDRIQNSWKPRLTTFPGQISGKKRNACK